MNPKQSRKTTLQDRGLDVEEIRLVADLRVMHAKVAELYHIVRSLKQHHNEAAVINYSDRQLLAENIQRVDEIYLWYVKLKEETERLNGEL